ncbi:hypothetical protein GCM10023116_17080 [Kistimonas scapharcae]|uniref:Membrane fusion protein biotin-lipoyl like domain-containing protein n=1 Tax=Kistimonas scapharcae TaxID=1036133 RepID=A0ABP8V0C7_9GAMM
MTTATSNSHQTLVMQRLASLLTLQQRLRAASDVTAIARILVNDTRHLFEYRVAAFYRQSRILAVSGLPEPVTEAPFTQWLRAVCRHLEKQVSEEPAMVAAEDLPQSLRQDWSSFLPEAGLWLPVKSNTGEWQGGLFLAAVEPWKPEQTSVLAHLAEAAAHAIHALQVRPKVPLTHLKKKKLSIIVAVLIAAAMFIPVPESALAPAEIVAYDMEVVRSPLDGVIGELLVKPNQKVAAGEQLARLDDRSLKARLDVAKQALEIAGAEYRRGQQAATGYREVTTPMPVLKARIAQNAAEVAYLESQLARVDIRAKHDGVVVLNDPDVLKGKPVRLGERLLAVAAPESAEIQFWLPVEESLPLPDQAPVSLFLNVAPDKALSGHVRYINYQAEVSPEGIFAFRGRALLQPEENLPRLGWRGTARISGENVSLFYYLFRRPFAAARQWLGL